MNTKREGFIFYRSFYEALEDLPKENQLELYKAISYFSFTLEEPKLEGLSKTIWTLIKPQLEANNKRYLNGVKPKQKQNRSKTEANNKQDESKQEANNKQTTSKTEAKEKEKEKEKVKENVKEKDIIINNNKDSIFYNIVKKFFDFHMLSKTASLLYMLKSKTENDIISSWILEVDKLSRIDKYSLEQIECIFNFTMQDPFRSKVIQTPKKFREKKDDIPYFVVMIEKLKNKQTNLSYKQDRGPSIVPVRKK